MGGMFPSLRPLLKRKGIIVAPGCFGALSAKVVERLEFEAVALGGFATGMSLGTLEPLLTATEQIDAARRITGAVNIPLVVDGHTGFGLATHAARTIRAFEAAGVAGVHIEDQPHLKPAQYHKYDLVESPLIPIDSFLKKIKACVDARRTDDFVIIARSDAMRVIPGSKGVDETVKRAEAVAEVGADMFMASGCVKADDIKKIASSISLPLYHALVDVSLGGSFYSDPSRLSVKELEELGVKLVVYPASAIYACTKTLINIWRKLKEKGTTALPDEDFEEVSVFLHKYLVNVDKLTELEKE